ncbi:hypothetical protein [Streptomyces reniochalinae]|uniref:Sensor domain-containing protein n=1 Tax=Streptomyces reniochalinae TaxID=2250578 RepID=A0A367EA52_9ACTN|nr:hypothetical protein [Streptomyces reniochalinae]RCG14873.1 hypothetical protein DQ392_27725 [Streptomyces reniochalinae]
MTPLTQQDTRDAVLRPEDLGAGWEAKKLKDVSRASPGSQLPSGDGSDDHVTTGNTACDAALLPSEAITPVAGAERDYDQDGTGVSMTAEVTTYKSDGAQRTVETGRAVADDCAGLAIPWDDGMTATFSRISTSSLGDDTLGVRVVYRSDDAAETRLGLVDIVTVRVGKSICMVSFLIENGSTDADTIESVTSVAAQRLADVAHG